MLSLSTASRPCSNAPAFSTAKRTVADRTMSWQPTPERRGSHTSRAIVSKGYQGLSDQGNLIPTV